MTLGEVTELATGMPDIASAVDEILAPLAEDVEMACEAWAREHYAGPPARFVLGASE